MDRAISTVPPVFAGGLPIRAWALTSSSACHVGNAMNRYAIAAMALLAPIAESGAKDLRPPVPYPAYEAEGGSFKETRLFRSGICYALRRRDHLLNNDFGVTQTKAGSCPGSTVSKPLCSITSRNYSRQQHVLKADVVCMADKIVVDEPIFTNGGDIYIFASQLTVSAPIDTRLYIEQFPANPYFESFKETFRHPKGRESVRNAYRTYYTGCSPCNAKSEYARAPRLPPGLISLRYPPRAKIPAGTAPPDDAVDFRVARSGSIYLTASSLTLRNSEPTSEQTSLLQVSGIPGGLGGPGTVAQCAGRGRCNDPGYKNSGHSGPGGRGGPAGSVLLMLLDAPPSDTLFAELSANADVGGGASGPNEMRRTPFAPDGGQIIVPREEWRIVQPSWPAAANGSVGDVTVVQADAASALGELHRFASTVDGNVTLDLADLYYRAAHDETVKYSSMRAFVVHRMAQAALDAGAHIARDLEAKAGGPQQMSDSPLWQSLRGIDEANVNDFSPDERRWIFLLKGFDIPNGSGASEYFALNGGAFAFRSRDIYTRYWQDAQLLASARSLELESRILLELTDAARVTLYQVTAERRSALRATLESALRALQAAEAETRASYGDNRMKRFSDALRSAKDPISKFAGALATDNFATIASSAPGAASALREVQASLVGSKWHPDDTSHLRDAMTAAREALSEFEDEAAVAREAVIQRYLASHGQVLRSRQEAQMQMDKRAFLIPEMLKHVLVTHANDAERDADSLRTNALAVQAFAATFPGRDPNFDFIQDPKTCHLGAPGSPVAQDCLEIPVMGARRIVYGNFGEPTYIRLPLYVVAPGAGPFAFPNYGLNDVTIEPSGNPVSDSTRPVDAAGQ